MFAALLQVVEPVDPNTLDAAINGLTDAFVAGDLTLAIVSFSMAAALVALRFLGKKFQFVDSIVEIALTAARQLPKKRAPPAAPTNVVDINKDKRAQ